MSRCVRIHRAAPQPAHAAKARRQGSGLSTLNPTVRENAVAPKDCFRCSKTCRFWSPLMPGLVMPFGKSRSRAWLYASHAGRHTFESPRAGSPWSSAGGRWTYARTAPPGPRDPRRVEPSLRVDQTLLCLGVAPAAKEIPMLYPFVGKSQAFPTN